MVTYFVILVCSQGASDAMSPRRRAIAMISLRQHPIGVSTPALIKGANAVDLVVPT
jgi:hypothetical protein